MESSKFYFKAALFCFQIRAGEESDERGHIVVREYEDFEWLHHCIVTENDISAVIVSLISCGYHLVKIYKNVLLLFRDVECVGKTNFTILIKFLFSYKLPKNFFICACVV